MAPLRLGHTRRRDWVERPVAPRSGATRALSWAGVVVGVLASVLIVRELATSWPEVEVALRGATWSWLAVAAVLASLGMVTVASIWGSVLRLLGVTPAGRWVVAGYFVGEIGKYVPGGIWPVLGRGEFARRRGVPAQHAYGSVALSLAMLYLAATLTLVGLLPFAFGGGLSSSWFLFLLGLPVGLMVLHPHVLARLAQVVSRLTGREIGVPVPAWRASLLLILRYTPCWLLIGTATWALARSIAPDASWPRMVFAASLSWLAGFVAVPVPAGAGVREAAFLAACGLPTGLAVTTAVGARILFVLVDAVGAALGAVFLYRRRPRHGLASQIPSSCGDVREASRQRVVAHYRGRIRKISPGNGAADNTNSEPSGPSSTCVT